MDIEIGVLDLNSRLPEQSALDSIRSTERIVRHAEALGFQRYWVTEHHEKNSSHCAPEVLVAILAAQTQRIHLGAGGVLLRYRDPYLVAQAFSLLSALFPGRIDLGIARGRIGGSIKKYFEHANVTDEVLDQKCMILSGFFQTRNLLRPLSVPPVWMLGGKGAVLGAVQNHCCFCLDQIYQEWPDELIKDTLIRYEDDFLATSTSHTPQSSVAIAGICAKSDDEARKLAMLSAQTGFPRELIKAAIVGSPERWIDYLCSARTRWGTRRFMILVASNDEGVKRDTLSLLGDALHLPFRFNEEQRLSMMVTSRARAVG